MVLQLVKILLVFHIFNNFDLSPVSRFILFTYGEASNSQMLGDIVYD